jgi:type 1 glutamine amidotransferase
MKLLRTNISRRTLVQNAGIVAGAGLLGLAASESVQSQSAAPARGNGKPRALALIGDRFHNADYIRVSLDKVFKDLDIPIDYTIQYDSISADLLKNYQLLLILRDGMIWPDGYLGPDAYTAYEADLETPKTFPNPTPVTWMKEEQGAAIKEFVTAGNGFYALHNCSHISLGSKDYREVMGGAYISHPPLRPFEVHATKNKHPITEGMSSFMVNDEQHYVTYDKDPKYIILEAENVDGLKFQDLGTKSVSGWAYDYGNGRLLFTAVGHTIHAMWNPEYLKIQKNGVRWLLKMT